MDLGIEPYLAASSLLGVLAQRLIRRVCPHCKTMVPLDEVDRRRLGVDDGTDGPSVARGTGCGHCFDTGYFERIGIFELLEINNEIRNLIGAQPNATALHEAARRAGMSTLRGDALAKLWVGQTTAEEVVRVTHREGSEK